MNYQTVVYANCPYCHGLPGDTQCIPCYERSLAPVYTAAPLTEADVRRIVREELARHTSDVR